MALRLSEAGLLGDARRYVVVVRDDHGRLLQTPFIGTPAYPDVPPQPVFVAAEGPRVTYDVGDPRLEETNLRTFFVGPAPNKGDGNH